MAVSQNTYERWRLGAALDPNIIPVNQLGKTVANVDHNGHTIWPGACVTTPGLSFYEFSVTDDITHVVSSSGSDTGPLVINGLRGDGTLTSVTVPALTGTAPVALPEPLMQPNNATYPFGGNVGRISVIKGDDVTAGIPNADGDVKLIIEPGEGLSNQAVYRVPAGHKCSLIGGYVQLFSAKGVSTTAVPAWGGAANLGGTQVGLFLNFGDLELSDAHFRHDEDYLVPQPLPELNTIEIRVLDTSGATVTVRSRFFAWVIKDNV